MKTKLRLVRRSITNFTFFKMTMTPRRWLMSTRGPDDGWSETHQSWFWDADTDPPPPNCKQFTSKRLIILNTQQFMLLLNNLSSIQHHTELRHCVTVQLSWIIVEFFKHANFAVQIWNLKQNCCFNPTQKDNPTQLSHLYTIQQTQECLSHRAF